MTEYQKAVEALAKNFQELTGGNHIDLEAGVFSTFVGFWAMQNFSITECDVSFRNECVSIFKMPEEKVLRLLELSLRNADVYDLCVHIVSSNIIAGAYLPEDLRIFAAGVLKGQYKRPTPPHRSRDSQFVLSLSIFQLLTTAIQFHNLKMTRNDESPSLSACDAVSDALAKCGLSYSFSQLKEYCVSPRKSALRREVQTFLYNELGDGGFFFLNTNTVPKSRSNETRA